MMRKKIGLFGGEKEDGVLIGDLLNWMEKNKLDFTNTFVLLGKKHPTKNSISKDKEFLIWQKKWLKRLEKNKKGMGLGIFISKNLINSLGGNIIFYNSE